MVEEAKNVPLLLFLNTSGIILCKWPATSKSDAAVPSGQYYHARPAP